MLPNDGRNISQNVDSLNIFVHNMINLVYYEHWKDKHKYFYVYQNALLQNHSSYNTETREIYDYGFILS